MDLYSSHLLVGIPHPFYHDAGSILLPLMGLLLLFIAWKSECDKPENSPSKFLLPSCLFLAFSASLLKELPVILDPLALNTSDVRTEIYWMQRFQDPELFRNDLLYEFASSGLWATKGFIFIYWVASYLIDPLTFSKLLPLLLITLTIFYLFQIGRVMRGQIEATMLVALFLVTLWEVRVPRGMPHSFVTPLLLAFLYYLMNRRFLAVALVVAAESLIYPSAMFISLGTFFCSILLEYRGQNLAGRMKSWRSFAYMLVMVFTLLSPSYLFGEDAKIAKLVTRQEAQAMPEFRAGGKFPVFRGSLWEDLTRGIGFEKKDTHLPIRLLTGAALFLFAVSSGRRLKTVPNAFWALLLAGMGLYLLAYFGFPKLYLPYRYQTYTIPIFLLVFVGTNIRQTGDLGLDHIRRRFNLQLSRSATLIVPAIFLIGFSLAIHRNYPWSGAARCPFPDLIQYLETVPKDALIAGHPMDMDWVPTFAKRKVLVNEELAVPWQGKYYEEIRRRTEDLFEAYYSTSPEQIRLLKEKYGVEYLVVNRMDYVRVNDATLRGRTMFVNTAQVISLSKEDWARMLSIPNFNMYPYEPFNDSIKRVISQNTDRIFSVFEFPPVWESKNLFVIKIK